MDLAKKFIHRLLAALGYELRLKSDRLTLSGALRQAARLGLDPATIVDAGAAHGKFHQLCRPLFPRSRFLLIEPLAEYDGHLAALEKQDASLRRVKACAGEGEGEITFNVHEDLVGSSLYAEGEDKVNGQPRRLPMTTLDVLAARYRLQGPYLLKADVQGGELDVLKGGESLLAETQLIVLEASFLPFFQGGPLAHELISWLDDRDFALYDIVGLAYRPLDGALAQADLVFARKDGFLRRDHRFATQEQRQQLTRRLKARL